MKVEAQYPISGFWEVNPKVRSAIKLVKDGKVSELNIDPQKIQPRDLFQEMVMGFKKLAKGKVNSDEKPVFYEAKETKNWIVFYQDSERPSKDWLKSYNNSFKYQK